MVIKLKMSMKKLIIILSALAILGACSKFEEIDAPLHEEEVVADSKSLPEVIYASVNNKKDESDTRTSVVDGYKIHWQSLDAISYFTGVTHNAQYIYNGNTSAPSVEFVKVADTGTTGDAISKSRGIYPYSNDHTVVCEEGIDKISVTYPSTQVYAENSFGPGANIMIATGDDNNDDELTFRNASGYLIIKLYGEDVKVKNITLKSLCNEDKIAGRALIVTDEDKTPVVAMSNGATTSVTLDCSNGDEGVTLSADSANPTEFWFALPPVNLSNGIQIVVTDINGNVYRKHTNKAVNIERNHIQPMAALEFVANTLPYNTLRYTLAGEGTTPIAFSTDPESQPFNASISEHYFDEDANKFVIKFNSALTTIKEAAFKDTGIQTIELPESLVTIEDDVFYNTPLTAISIPGSVNRIGVDAFYNCESLSSVTFLPSPEKTSLRLGYSTSVGIGKSSFYQSPLKSIYLDRELIFVDGDDKPFENNITGEAGVFSTGNKVEDVSLTLGDQVSTISKYMFCDLRIVSLTIPDNVMLIDRCAFKGCIRLTTLIFEESETPIEIRNQGGQANYGPFYQSDLTYIHYNRNIVYTSSNGEEFCPNGDVEGIFSINLTNSVAIKDNESTVYIGPLITDIPDYAFCNLPMRKLTIPKTVQTIGNDVFISCSSLHTITFEEHSEPITLGYETTDIDEGLFCDARLRKVVLNRQIIYPFTGGTLDSPSKGLFACEYEGNTYLTDITIGDKVTVLPPYTFAGAGASTVNLNKVTSIGKGAFENAKLTSITIPGSVVEISDNAFKYCMNLSTIRFEGSATPLTIGFQPGSILENEVGPFYQSPLTSIYVNRELVASESYAKARDEDDEGIFSTSSNSRDVSVILQGNVNTISDYMFSGVQMQTIWIPREVTSIGKEAFEDCSKLYGVTLAHSTPPALGVDAFDGTLLQDEDELRWIALEVGTEANINAFKNATNWSDYADIIQAQQIIQ